MFPKSPSLPTSFMLWRTFSTALHIHINHTPRPFSANCDNSSTKAKTIPLNSGNVPVASNGGSIKISTKTPNHSIWLPPSLAKHLGTIAENWIMTTSSSNGKWLSKHWMEKENNSLTYLMTTLTLLNQLIPKVDLGCKSSVTPILYVFGQQEPSPITHLLENTD